MKEVNKIVKFDVKQNITEEELFEIKIRLENLRKELSRVKNRENIESK